MFRSGSYAPSPLRSANGGTSATQVELYDIIPADHKQPYNARYLLDCLLDGGDLDEFQADYAKEMVTGHARVRGIQVGVIANNRGMIRAPGGGPPRFGGIIYTESAEKVALHRDLQPSTPSVHQDVGFMMSEAEHSGLIRAARFVEARATRWPQNVLTVTSVRPQ